MEKFSQGWGRARNSRSVLQLLLELTDAMIIVSASVSQIVGALAAGICLHHCAQCRTQPHVWRGSFMKTCVSVVVRAAVVLQVVGEEAGGGGDGGCDCSDGGDSCGHSTGKSGETGRARKSVKYFC